MILARRYNYPSGFHEKSLITLNKALNQTPAYAPWRAFDPGERAPLCERYGAMPGLTKQMIRDNFPSGLAPAGRDVGEGLLNGDIEYTFTSGTTGERVVNIWDQDWWNRAEAASWKLNAHTAILEYPQREAKLASSLNVGISCEEDLPEEYRTVGGKLYLNEKINLIQWQPRHFERMSRELKNFRPAVLEANPSLLARLAYWAIDAGVKMYSPEIIFFTYEFVSKIHLAAIRRVFSSHIISSFGTTETGFVLEECEAGFLHQNLEFCRIDFQPLKNEYGGPDLGRMLVTTFDNPWNIVVKFDTGDLARLHPRGKCACGRDEGMIAEAIEGRVSNVTFTTRGKPVTTMELDNALAAAGGIRDYHLEQHSADSYELRLIPEPAGPAADVENALRTLYGQDGLYDIKIVDNIYPGPAGKFRRTQADFEFDWKEWFV